MTPFIAALPMYDWPERRAEVDAEWAAIRDGLRAEGIAAPDRLVRRNADMPAVPGGIRDRKGRPIAPDPATLPPDELDLATLWRHPALLLAQTCWGPMELGLAPHVQVIGQPRYDGIEGGDGKLYSSAIVMRRGDAPARLAPHSAVLPSVLPDISPSRGEIGSFGVALSLATPPIRESRPGSISPLEGEMSGRTEGGTAECNLSRQGASIPLDLLRSKRFAYNSPDSMSGILALTHDLEAAGESLAIFSGHIETGGHRNSIVAVAEGRADVAAIDCRSWAMARRFEPAAQALVVVGWTAKRKGVPFITAKGTSPEVVALLKSALEDLK